VDFPGLIICSPIRCGTGGDGSGSINVSTARRFVAAAAGLPVAKHGNRSVDLALRLGRRSRASRRQARRLARSARRALDETGFCFLFAPFYIPASTCRPGPRALGVRTIMNVLGPCVNPAEPRVQLLGVADPALLEPVAQTLAALGVGRGAGRPWRRHGRDRAPLRDPGGAACSGAFEQMILSPGACRARAPAGRDIEGRRPGGKCRAAEELLMGYASPPRTEVVALNAGALLMTAGLAPDLREGGRDGARLDRFGRGLSPAQAFVEATNG
jgi:anthranilate phosphoribosyltransferase